MTLDPVHVDGIADLAGAIARKVDDTEYADLAGTVWDEWLDPLTRDGVKVVEPLGEKRLRAADVDDVALTDPPFPTVHGLDSGTINPTTFKNGLVMDVAHAAMGAVPSDLELHRCRSIVATVHASDLAVDAGSDWIRWDEGYGRRKVVQAPRVNRYAEGVVHALSLYLAESAHALEHADSVSDLLLLDGPVYPKELLRWRDRDAELADLTAEATPRAVVENYVRLVERFVDRGVPLAGFVKNPAAKRIVQTLREKDMSAPWADDAGLFTALLDPDDREDRRTDRLTFTSWFVSRGGTDRVFSTAGDALGIDRALPPEAYEVAFFALYDPRTDVLYRVEAPLAFARDPEGRDRLTHHVLRDVAATRGPPQAIEKADELARVNAEEKTALRRKFEERLGSDHVRTYDDVRWGESEE